MARAPKRPALLKQPQLIEFLQAELDVKDWLVRRWIKQGHVPAPAIDISGKSRWWRRADIETWLYGKQAA
jgi:hypothetical protein